MFTFCARNLNQILQKVSSKLCESGLDVTGKYLTHNETIELHPALIEMDDPCARTLLFPKRGNNPFSTLAETMWVLAGRDDVKWLEMFLPRAKDFSDDGCFTGDTKISLLNGDDVNIKDLVGKEFYVYSYDKDMKKIVPGKAKNCRCTGKKSIFLVELDNGEIIKTTSCHRFMTKDDEYKEVKNLSIGESLKPLYREINDLGYECAWSNNTRYRQTHRIMCDGITKQKDTVHHKDFNKRNNEPINLEAMNNLDHFIYHSDLKSDEMKKRWQDPKYREHFSKCISKSNKKRWSDPIYRSKMINKLNSIISTTEHRDKMVKGCKNKWENDLEFRLKMSEKIAKSNSNPTVIRLRFRGKITKIMRDIIESGLEITESNYTNYWKRGSPYYKNIDKYFESVEEAINEAKSYSNHKVVNVIDTGYEENVYDFEVEKYHNFALTSGIFVHNSVWRAGYGKRIRNWPNYKINGLNQPQTIDQLEYVYETLKKHPASRQAVISLWNPSEDCTVEKTKDFPCSNWLHFMIRDNKLDCVLTIRSNDLIWGLSSINVYEFTVIQEILARLLGVEVGKYWHFADSLHIYKKNNHENKIEDFANNTFEIPNDIPKFEFLKKDEVFMYGPNLYDHYMAAIEDLCDWLECEDNIKNHVYGNLDSGLNTIGLLLHLWIENIGNKEPWKNFDKTMSLIPFSDLKVSCRHWYLKNVMGILPDSNLILERAIDEARDI